MTPDQMIAAYQRMHAEAKTLNEAIKPYSVESESDRAHPGWLAHGASGAVVNNIEATIKHLRRMQPAIAQNKPSATIGEGGASIDPALATATDNVGAGMRHPGGGRVNALRALAQVHCIQR